MVNWLLANFFAKPKSKPVARFDVITNFLVSKSANWVRLAHWPRRGALCGRSKGGGLYVSFSGKICSSYAERVHEMPHSIAYYWTSLFRRDIFWGRRWGHWGVRAPGSRGDGTNSWPRHFLTPKFCIFP